MIDNRLPEDEKEQEKLPNDGRPWLQILIQEDGFIKVVGSTNDKLIAYGLLESARDAIKDHHDKIAKEHRLERVNNSGGLIEGLRRRFKQ